MKIRSLTVLLRDLEALLEAAGAHEGLQDVREFQQFLAEHESSDVSRLASKLASGREAFRGVVVSQPVKRLQDVFSKFQSLLVDAKSKKIADEVEKLAHLLDGCDHASIARFVEDAKRWVANEAPAGTPKTLRAELVRNYVDELTQASSDNPAFDHVVARLREDRAVREQEMREIANQYLGFEIAKKKGKKFPLQEIIDRQALDARQEARGRSHDRVKA
jgi:hypothetical protein